MKNTIEETEDWMPQAVAPNVNKSVFEIARFHINKWEKTKKQLAPMGSSIVHEVVGEMISAAISSLEEEDVRNEFYPHLSDEDYEELKKLLEIAGRRVFKNMRESKMKFKKSHIKQIIKEEISKYMQEVSNKPFVELEEEVIQETFVKKQILQFLGTLGAVDADKLESLLVKLNQVISKYAARTSGSGPVPTQAIQEVKQVLGDEGIVLQEITKAQIESAIKKFLIASGIAAKLAGPGAAKAADSITDTFAKAQQAQQYKGYQPGGTETYEMGGEMKLPSEMSREETALRNKLRGKKDAYTLYGYIKYHALKTKDPAIEALRLKILEFAGRGIDNLDDMTTAINRDPIWKNERAGKMYTQAWEHSVKQAKRHKWDPEMESLYWVKRYAAGWDKIAAKAKSGKDFLPRSRRFEPEAK